MGYVCVILPKLQVKREDLADSIPHIDKIDKRNNWIEEKEK